MTFVNALLALAAGYLVYLLASKEKKALKSLGQVIGAVVMIAAFASMLCGAYKYRTMCKTMGRGYGMMCPMSMK